MIKDFILRSLFVRPLAACFAICASAQAATFSVTNTANTGAGSLRQAVTNANNASGNDTITFAASLSGLTITLASEIVLRGVTVDASSLPNRITIDGADTTRIFRLDSAQHVTLRGLTLRRGNGVSTTGNGFGGAIYQSIGFLALEQCNLSGNEAGRGGAIYNSTGELTLTQCTLSGNSAQVFAGGAIYNDTGALELTECTLSDNTANSQGGAIYINNTDSPANLKRSTFSKNAATSAGGAIYNKASLVELTQCTLHENSAQVAGGAIYTSAFSEGSDGVKLIHCTLAKNSASGSGGAISSVNEPLVLTNCIVAGNTASNGPDIEESGITITATGKNIIGNLSGSSLTAGATVVTGNPLLGPFGNNGGTTQTLLPQAGSPAIHAAVGSAITTDQRGFPVLGTPDIGAAEAGFTFVTTGADELDPPGTGTGTSLREAVRDTPAGGTIHFAPALSGGTCMLTTALGGEIVLGKSVTIDASTLPAGLTLDGGTGNNRIFSIPTGQAVTLKSLSLSGGNGEGLNDSGNGGAIRNTGALTLTRCTLYGNSANFGGAIYIYQGTLTMTQCTISGNSASSGGGAILEYESTLTLTQCTLSGNSASYGGAIYEDGGALTLTNSIVAGNTTPALGADFNRVDGTITPIGKNLIGSLGGSGLSASNTSVITGAPILAPLGNYGGPTRTMPPLAGSAAIDAAVGSTFITDQRGFPIAGLPDIGAADNGIRVSTVADELDPIGTPGTGISLREALRDTPAGGGIGFNPALSGQTITLGSARGEIVLTKSVGIDASSLPAGLTINGGTGTNRIFTVESDQSVTLKGLTLMGGNGSGTTSSGFGGALCNLGALSLTQCTLSGNLADYGGGAIYNQGTLTLTQCTLSGNRSKTDGGAIYGGNTLNLTQCVLSGNSAENGGAVYIFLSSGLTITLCTLSGNSAETNGGAILIDRSTLALTHCTLHGNIADSGSGIFHGSGTLALTHCTLSANQARSRAAIYGNATMTLNNTIVAGNSAPTNPEIDGHFTGTNNLTTGTPLLAPLGNYGGPTQTMALMPGSPARNAGAVLSPAITTDQRGLPVVGTPDIGAYEIGTFNSFATWAWETAGSPLAFDDDNENDGASNGLEYATRRDPNMSDIPLSPVLAPAVDGGHTFQFRYQKDARDLRYIVQRSNSLTGWTEVYRYDISTGQFTPLPPFNLVQDTTNQLITITDRTTGPRLFWRLVIEPVL